MLPRVLTIAGSDSSGGAGIQADLKTFTALGVYGMTALTAVTVQTTSSVYGVYPLPSSVVYDQICRVIDDIGVDIIKIGMLANADIIEAVVEAVAHYPEVPLVLDPVMRAKGGASLLDEEAQTVLREQLAVRVQVLTPNLPEAEALVGFPVRSTAEMEACAQVLGDLGISHVVVKGGHLDGPVVRDLLWQEGRGEWISHARLETMHTHGTGCTLSSAIAAFWARGETPAEAIRLGIRYVYGAIEHAPGLGRGHGPLHHTWGQPRWM